MNKVYLIGFMGCGKSTIGTELSTKLDIVQLDTDDYIEEKYNTKISDIFRVNGENTFREYEAEALEEIDVDGVISTGGGIVEKKESIKIMNNKGIIIYLSAFFNEIVKRLESDQNRPLWDKNKEDEMKVLFDKRISLYKKHADYTIDTTNKTVAEIASEIELIINMNK